MDKNTTPLLLSDPEEGKETFQFDPEAIVARINGNKAAKAAAREAEDRQRAKEYVREVFARPTLILPIVINVYGVSAVEMNKILDELVKKPHPFTCEFIRGWEYKIKMVEKGEGQ